jgi:hypothetical protein
MNPETNSSQANSLRAYELVALLAAAALQIAAVMTLVQEQACAASRGAAAPGASLVGQVAPACGSGP